MSKCKVEVFICDVCGKENVLQDYQCECGNINDMRFTTEILKTKKNNIDKELKEQAKEEHTEVEDDETTTPGDAINDSNSVHEGHTQEIIKEHNELDINNDGVVDAKDASLAGKVLADSKKQKKKKGLLNRFKKNKDR